MNILENISTIASLIAAILSIVMFFLSKQEKDKCIEIKKQIEQNIEISNKKSSIESKDSFNIKEVTTFDNRKSIN
ncbi:hypothetical protein LTX14_002494 [Clostridium perfringens]|uniref:hypothetical protein n=1 Tax=Clostridium perfringens TaxID=1502 RepID=UPI001240D6D2|nr:hypothetical protein [Clostridium perfringens]MDU7726614.1 hypothetical protein [Clostridium perfringens]BDA35897.1 hypothetical protein CPBEC5_29050 [Clostridium perfringens]HAT4120280.1 hypothetical protein [Clostridium perfringens]HCG3019998.1 hypothetical protein [Clostridium perfringens]